jgi:hypothetical protein
LHGGAVKFRCHEEFAGTGNDFRRICMVMLLPCSVLRQISYFSFHISDMIRKEKAILHTLNPMKNIHVGKFHVKKMIS